MAKGAVHYAPTLYTKPPKSAIPGARVDFRQMELTKAELEVAAANNSILAIGILPAGHRLCGLFVECDPLSTGADLVFDVGILNNYYNEPEANVAAVVVGFDSGVVPALVSSSVTLADGTVIAYGKILAGATIGRSSAAGRVDSLASTSLAPSLVSVGVDKIHDRIIAIDITTQATTGVAGTIAIGVLTDMED